MILGSQKNPWGFENIAGKFRDNAALALSDEGVTAAVDAWSDITQVTDLTEVISRTLVK